MNIMVLPLVFAAAALGAYLGARGARRKKKEARRVPVRPQDKNELRQQEAWERLMRYTGRKEDAE